MYRFRSLALLVGLLLPAVLSAPAHAQATRTWVSGVGDDVNPCSRTAPCKTFAGAISKTAAGGEINCLDPGGFGGVTITKAMTLNCTATLGSILVAGTPGVTINAGATDRVTLRGIQIQGLNQTPAPGTIGVRIIGAAVVSIEDCVITAFGQQGVSDARTAGNTKLLIRNTIISNNTSTGVAGVATGPNNIELENVSLINNLFGVAAGTGNNIVAKRSVFSGNTSAGVEADSGGSVSVDDSAISGNTTGILGTGNLRVSNSDIVFNGTAFGGASVTYGNNRVVGTLGTTPTPASQQ
ncbi:right-handed parallel beta-helix repeat-containing protein [Bradyrhizobium sp. LTSPM299]|uniref:right-handed parallel beta-helix repeat-containing protein n=1 Tax=Bradyrhizobium sp. LTSPM299 TaxID=1619233 RepID=UPI0005C8BCC5|nr:right-handed parallel beta-helix repeat-containing protein [Bradyrhizobium sp. LTSPM299]